MAKKNANGSGSDKTAKMPISNVRWVPREKLRANAWNPNIQATPEFELLKVSILENGWTQPIVVTPDGEIVDGFHRWKLSADPEIAALTDGLVPVVRLPDADIATLKMSTVRHNRARGTHAVLRMADLVRDLAQKHGVAEEEIMRRLGMEDEEVERLIDTSGMTARGRGKSFSTGWVPE